MLQLTPPDIWGRTPLHLAAKAGHVDIVKMLIQKSADVDAQDCKGITPLLLAGCIGDRGVFENIVQVLVEKGADVTKMNIITGKLNFVSVKLLTARFHEEINYIYLN